MTEAAKHVEALRACMKREGVDAYVIPTADFHQSEYVGDHFKARAWLSGFTGSYGTVIVTQDEAYLWTDGRYWYQAEKEMAGSGIGIQKMFEPGTLTETEWLATNVPENGTVGFDGRVLAMGEGQGYEKELAPKNIKINYHLDFINEIWEDRPALSKKPAFFLEEKYSGESTESKLKRIREAMKKNGATAHVIASLDDTCWILNIRGDDVDFFPLLLSYSIITMDQYYLYVDESKFDDQIRSELKKNNVTVLPYNQVYEDLRNMSKDEVFLIDPMKMNYALYKDIPESAEIVEEANPSILMKAMKNETEIKNIKEAHIKDGVAVTKFMYWVKNNYDKMEITELSATDKLAQLRSEQPGYIRDSFEPLIAYKDHAAMMHYSPSKETDVVFREGAFVLNDTGGGYYQGSTDITRTFALGEVSDELKKFYTTVLKAMMNLSQTVFMYGCYGYNLDVIVREPVWRLYRDFKCGSGHGVGYLGNVHEPPTGFRWYVVPSKNEHHILEPGMVLTDEPGIYIDDYCGVRIENELLVKECANNSDGRFMDFETITFCPMDLDAIDPKYLSPEEIEWLNNYHKDVYEKISPYLTPEEQEWLKSYTRAI